MNTPRKTISNNLKHYRQKSGYTQQQVATLMGKQIQDRLSHWEQGGTTPSIQNLLLLCKLYKVSVEDIYTTRNP